MVAALLLVALRVLTPFAVGSDQAVQFEGAIRLASGLGLTTTSVTPPADLTQPVTPQYITRWPPGLSLTIALLLVLGLPLAAAAKFLFAAITLAGWYGWAVLARRTLAGAAPVGVPGRAAAALVSAAIPLFLTPGWGASDIFLWAGVPFFILLLARRREERQWKYEALAGLLFGVLFAFRYASGFLMLLAAFILIYTSLPRWIELLKRGVVLAAFSALLAVPVLAFIRAKSDTGSAVPNVVPEQVAAPDLATKARWIVAQLPAAWQLSPGLSYIDVLARRAASDRISIAAGIAALLFFAGMPLAARRVRATDLVVCTAMAPIALVVFLASLYDGLLLSISRYYEPAAMCTVAVLPVLAAGRSRLVVGWISRAALVALVVYVCVYLPLRIADPRRRAEALKDTVGYNSTASAGAGGAPTRGVASLYTRAEETDSRIVQLSIDNPGALFVVQPYPRVVLSQFDRTSRPPGGNLRPYGPPAYWGQAYTSMAVRIFWVVYPQTDLSSLGLQTDGPLYESREEQVKIVLSDLPAGHRFSAPPIPHE
jgi:hypothetical protein